MEAQLLPDSNQIYRTDLKSISAQSALLPAAYIRL